MTTASDAVYIGLESVKTQKSEFTAAEVRDHAPADMSDGTLYRVLNALERHGLLQKENRGNQTVWRPVEADE